MESHDEIDTVCASAVVPANPEMGTTQPRRCISDKEKLRILAAADEAAASEVPGAVGAVMRREGVYSSMLCKWRRNRNAGILTTGKGRGKAQVEIDLQAEVETLRRENSGLRARMAQAEKIIDLQKKVSELLSIPLMNAQANGGIG
jgi:transposase